MEGDVVRSCAILPAEGWSLGEGAMIQEDRWKEIRRLHEEEGLTIAEIARRLELDRKTVRRCLREPSWRPYQRVPRADTVLAPFAENVQERAPELQYSAQILFQELRRRGYRGSYETVKRSVRPMRAVEAPAVLMSTRVSPSSRRSRRCEGRTARRSRDRRDPLRTIPRRQWARAAEEPARRTARASSGPGRRGLPRTPSP